MDFETFRASVLKLSDIILKDDFKPDTIVAVARGGWIPAILLARIFKIKQVYSCGLTYADATRTVINAYQDVALPKSAQKILVVEDFLESGKCIKHAIERLQSDDRVVRSACIGYLQTSIVMPNYSHGCVNEIPQMPWD